MAPDEVVWPIGAAVLVAGAGLCAAADAALSRVSRVQVDDYVREGRRGAPSLRKVIAEPPRYLNLVLLLRVVGEMAAAVVAAAWAVGHFSTRWSTVLITAAVMVVASYVVVGVMPRTLGRQHAGRVALLTAPIVYRLAAVLGPLPRLLIAFGNAITPGRGFRDGPFTSEAELRDLVDLAEASQVIESDERQMIHSVFELGDTIVREVMVPRTDIVFIERGKTLRQAMSLALRSGFSRIPVVGANEDDVVGIAYLRDLARRSYEYRESESSERVESLMRPATFVPDSKPVDELLREMQAARNHVAIVVDEYGGTAGLVTIEDILEEIVGEITDEYDRELPRVEELPDGAMRVTARLPVDELEQLFGVKLEQDDDGVGTVGGLLAQALGRVPIPGAGARVGPLHLVAEGALGRRNRVATVVVRAADPSEADAATRDASATPKLGAPGPGAREPGMREPSAREPSAPDVVADTTEAAGALGANRARGDRSRTDV